MLKLIFCASPNFDTITIKNHKSTRLFYLIWIEFHSILCYCYHHFVVVQILITVKLFLHSVVFFFFFFIFYVFFSYIRKLNKLKWLFLVDEMKRWWKNSSLCVLSNYKHKIYSYWNESNGWKWWKIIEILYGWYGYACFHQPKISSFTLNWNLSINFDKYRNSWAEFQWNMIYMPLYIHIEIHKQENRLETLNLYEECQEKEVTKLCFCFGLSIN